MDLGMNKTEETYRIRSPLGMWKPDYSNPSKCSTMNIYLYEIPIPPCPNKKEIHGYGRKKSSQKFEREVIPHDLKRWDPKKQEAFVEMMFHYAANGKWFYVNGKPIYVNGLAWVYYNFWTTEKGGVPDFRMEGIEFFTLFDYCWRDPNCYGLLDIKGRRIGDTDKSVFIMWYIAAFYRKAWCGHQNVDEDAAQENYFRILEGHSNMPFFFKPVMGGSTQPKKVMLFDYPENYISNKKLKEKSKAESLGDYKSEMPTYEPLKSKINYETSVHGKYDGKRLAIYYLDEPGKITAFNPVRQWEVVKPALAVENGSKIIGFGLFTTTVEDVESGNTLLNIKELWDKSDPLQKNKNGRTISGLYRVFRNATLSHAVDEFGYPKVDEAIEMITNEKKALEAISDYDGIARFMRKHPLTIDDVFKPPHSECTLFPILLDRRIEEIKNNIDPITGTHFTRNHEQVKAKIVEGNLVWKDNVFGGTVQFLPEKGGKFHLSQMPTIPNNKIIKSGRVYPGNDDVYNFGCDPIDHVDEGKKISTAKSGKSINRSFAAGAIYRKFNSIVDGYLDLGEEGEIIYPSEMQTDQYVCDYQFRPIYPEEFYEDMLMAAIFFGVKMFFENQKIGIANYFRMNGFSSYLKNKPLGLSKGNQKKRNRSTEKGAPATTNVINLYVGAMKQHVATRIANYHHLRILNCHRLFTTSNRTERDLTVACGYSLIADFDKKPIEVKEEEKKWSKGFYDKVKR